MDTLSFSLASSTATQVLFTARARLHNAAPIGVYLGDTRFAMFHGTDYVGTAVARDAVILPGLRYGLARGG